MEKFSSAAEPNLAWQGHDGRMKRHDLTETNLHAGDARMELEVAHYILANAKRVFQDMYPENVPRSGADIEYTFFGGTLIVKIQTLQAQTLLSSAR